MWSAVANFALFAVGNVAMVLKEQKVQVNVVEQKSQKKNLNKLLAESMQNTNNVPTRNHNQDTIASHAFY